MDDSSMLFRASGIARIRDVIANADHLAVHARCEHCGHIGQINWSALAISHSEEKSLRTLARSIRCKACGARGCAWQLNESHLIPDDPPPEDQRRLTTG
jgi:hypothetical protein